MNEKAGVLGDITVGDRVILDEGLFPGESRKILAEVVDIRIILGEQIYVVEAEGIKRKMVNASRIRKFETHI